MVLSSFLGVKGRIVAFVFWGCRGSFRNGRRKGLVSSLVYRGCFMCGYCDSIGRNEGEISR